MPGLDTIAPDSGFGFSALGTSADSPVVHRYRLGAELRRLRRERHLRLEDAAASLGVRPSTLSRIETGQAPTRAGYLNALLDLYEVDRPDQRARLDDMAREGQRKAWWAGCADLLTPGTCRYLDLEAIASQVRVYSALTVPSLLQTADYAAAVHRASRPGLTSGQIAKLAALTIRRQRSLRRDDIRVHVIIDHAALTRPIASADVIKAQWEHLATAASTATVTIQVTGQAAATILSPTFTVLTFANSANAEVGYCDWPGGQVNTTTREGDVRGAHAIFDALVSAALSPARSVELISNLLRG